MTFGEETIRNTVSKLLSGFDYRDEIINYVNNIFFDFSIEFFKQIVRAKFDSREINLNWYREYFIDSDAFTPDESIIYAGLNKKTVMNTYGTSSKNIMLDAARNNFDYLCNILSELEKDSEDGLAVTIQIKYNGVTVELSLTESMLVINALATKKLQIRGGAWSTIGKRVEKPLVDELCRLAGVPNENIDNTPFRQNKNLAYDRETDYKLISRQGRIYRVEVKLMGKGNPESADAVFARDSDIFIADTLSEQNCRQLEERSVKYLMLRNNNNSLNDFIKILNELDIPCS
ncbi:MAG: CfrBI family restriction endonuclease [Synergistaceae bacterium]|nr:CfrBI family restriction endonuclease [Synergistaceae bacterium]